MPLFEPDISGSAVEVVNEVLSSDPIGLGPKVEEFGNTLLSL